MKSLDICFDSKLFYTFPYYILKSFVFFSSLTLSFQYDGVNKVSALTINRLAI